MIFISHNQVRMHDTDMAGILYFARQFRFAHDALEDFMEKEGLTFQELFTNKHYAFVIVHAEADYFAPLRVGDKLEVHVQLERIGTTSLNFIYHIYKKGKQENKLVGLVKTVHVTIETINRTKQPIPEELKERFKKYLTDHSAVHDTTHGATHAHTKKGSNFAS